jgi:APA family basic amino acid/polyamine antiporter
MIWIGPRVAMTMGEDFPILGILARRSRHGTPQAAILVHALTATALLLTRSFEAVLDFIQFGLLCCSFLTVLGVVKLRFTDPDLPRPYRAWGYPVTPLIFLSVTAFTLYYLAVSRPLQSIAGFGIMLLGLVLYGLAANHALHVPAKTAATPK